MRKLEIVAIILLIIGGLNWGVIGFFGMDVIYRIFENAPIIARVIFCLIGVAALYQIFLFKPIRSRFFKK